MDPDSKGAAKTYKITFDLLHFRPMTFAPLSFHPPTFVLLTFLLVTFVLMIFAYYSQMIFELMTLILIPLHPYDND